MFVVADGAPGQSASAPWVAVQELTHAEGHPNDAKLERILRFH
ncbi:MAG TPA: hypothetical protein VFG22_17300 [Polyangiales bacterium]|nr:hypothetical protein [Polyangiales bacterium]